MTVGTEQRTSHDRQTHASTLAWPEAMVDRDVVTTPALFEARSATVRVAVATVCLLGTQFLHWSVIDQHAQVWHAAGVFFFVLALVEGLMTVLLIARLRPMVAAAGIVASVVPIVVWAWDRAVGLPFGPSKGIRGTIGRSDVMSVVFEVLTVVALWPFLKSRYANARRPPRLDLVGRVVIGATCVYVVGFSYWASLGDLGSIHVEAAATATGAGPTAAANANANVAPVAALVATQTLSYAAKEYGFDGPTTAAAGVTRIVLQNVGAESHDLEVARIPESSPTPSSLSGLEAMFADAQFSRPDAPSILADSHRTDAGKTSTLIVDLTPGRYILGCANATTGSAYHYAQGMITLLTVGP